MRTCNIQPLKSQTIANIIDKDLPYVPWLTPYLYALAGMGMTIAVQSSSIILAILTPICGLGIVSLERAYPIVVGCDIGTTFTGLLAAFANPGTGKWVKLFKYVTKDKSRRSMKSGGHNRL